MESLVMEVKIWKTCEFVELSKGKVNVFSVLVNIFDICFVGDSSGSEKKEIIFMINILYDQR